jgi:hypothetical protein
MKQLAAPQGKSDEEVRRAGGRLQYSLAGARKDREAARGADPVVPVEERLSAWCWDDPGVDLIARALTLMRTRDIYVSASQEGGPHYIAQRHDGYGEVIAEQPYLADLLADLRA